MHYEYDYNIVTNFNKVGIEMNINEAIRIAQTNGFDKDEIHTMLKDVKEASQHIEVLNYVIENEDIQSSEFEELQEQINIAESFLKMVFGRLVKVNKSKPKAQQNATSPKEEIPRWRKEKNRIEKRINRPFNHSK